MEVASGLALWAPPACSSASGTLALWQSRHPPGISKPECYWFTGYWFPTLQLEVAAPSASPPTSDPGSLVPGSLRKSRPRKPLGYVGSLGGVGWRGKWEAKGRSILWGAWQGRVRNPAPTRIHQEGLTCPRTHLQIGSGRHGKNLLHRTHLGIQVIA